MLVDAAKHGDVEIPGLLLRAQARQPRRRLPHVPGRNRGHPQAADRLLDPGQGRHGRAHPDRARQDRAERGRRVPADQPPARLPRLRQGRRVPAAGHHLRLGQGHLALHRAQAPLRQAAGALAADRDRPRALHPLLPLRALLAGDLRGLPAGAARARHALLRLDLRRASLRGPVQRQHRRAVPRRRAHLAGLPLPRAALGHRGRGLGLHAVPGPVQRHLHRPRRARRCACSRASTPRSTTAGSATRAASPISRSTSTSASPSHSCATAASCARSPGSARWRRPPRVCAARAARSPRSPAARAPTRRACCSRACMREGLASEHVDTVAGLDPADLHRLAEPSMQATVPDLEFAHTVLVIGTEPVHDIPILDLRIRKGVRRHGVKLAIATPRPSSLDANADAVAALRARRRAPPSCRRSPPPSTGVSWSRPRRRRAPTSSNCARSPSCCAPAGRRS